jgi:glutamate---cysteine ligase / carboxylate-amine ligase
MSALPAWAAWNPGAAARPWTAGIEEEVMLLEPHSGRLAWHGDEVLARLSPGLQAHTAAETHACALELATRPHRAVEGAVAELGALRLLLARQLREQQLSAAVAGTHPTVTWEEVEVSPGARYQFLHGMLGELARREPTFGLHLHVAVPDPELAVRAFDRIRAHLPVLLALSANSPFWQGRDSGLASVRTPVFGTFPRTGLPRRAGDYAGYVEAIDALLRADAIPEPTFVWWDARLQPRFGTLEVRILDAQTRLGDTAAIAALTQCLVRLEALEGTVCESLAGAQTVLEENRFIASRDGMAAQLVDPRVDARRPVGDWLAELLLACAPHAEALGCAAELARVPALAADPGAERQRRAARAGGVTAVVPALEADFVAAESETVAVHAPAG